MNYMPVIIERRDSDPQCVKGFKGGMCKTSCSSSGIRGVFVVVGNEISRGEVL